MPEADDALSAGEQEVTGTQPAADPAAGSTDKTPQKAKADEAANYRVKLRAAERERDELRAQIQSLTDSPTAASDKAELATLKRQFETIQSQLKAAEDKSKAAEEKVRKKTLQAALSSIAANAQLTDTASAIELLEKRARVADDDAVVFTIKGEDGKEIEIEATAENVRKHNLLPAIFFPAEGVAGAGSKAGAKATAVALDLQRAATDTAYYLANREAIKKARTAAARAK